MIYVGSVFSKFIQYRIFACSICGKCWPLCFFKFSECFLLYDFHMVLLLIYMYWSVWGQIAECGNGIGQSFFPQAHEMGGSRWIVLLSCSLLEGHLYYFNVPLKAAPYSHNNFTLVLNTDLAPGQNLWECVILALFSARSWTCLRIRHHLFC